MSAARFLPPQPFNLRQLAHASEACQGCELYRNATQVVFGEGPEHAALMLIGEQPSSEEDLTGRPFVGASGLLLDDLLKEAGIPRTKIYLTSAVKHFGFIRTGTKRRGVTPRPAHIAACRPWLEAQLCVIRPRVIVCLGRTAARSVLLRDVSIAQERGKPQASQLPAQVFVTFHPASLLRASAAERYVRHMRLVEDLRLAWRMAQQHAPVQAPTRIKA